MRTARGGAHQAQAEPCHPADMLRRLLPLRLLHDLPPHRHSHLLQRHARLPEVVEQRGRIDARAEVAQLLLRVDEERLACLCRIR